MSVLYRYLLKEYESRYRKSLITSEFADITYKETLLERFQQEDSGIFVCKQGELFSAGKVGKVDPLLVFSYRKQVMDTLIAYS